MCSLEKGWGLPGLALAMILISLGGGGFRAVAVPFSADLHTDTIPRFKKLRVWERVAVGLPAYLAIYL